jgi:deoxyribonuclease IV
MVLCIGTAGIPRSAKKNGVVAGIRRAAENGFTAQELEFVHGVYMKPELAKQVGKVAKELGITLTVHAPFYVNLNSQEPAKIHASMARIISSAKIGAMAGAKSVTFHAAYYMKKDPKEVYLLVKDSLLKIKAELKRAKVDIRISPEITGKHSAFGDLDELLSLAKELDIGLCIDFAHLHARANGKFNSQKDFDAIFEKVVSVLGNRALKDLHMHVSGINYTEKGERNHLMFKDADFPIKALVSSLKSHKVGGVLICESPNPEEDTKYLMSLF